MKRIPLHDRAGSVVAHTLVDDGDYERVAKRRWRLDDKGYVVTSGGSCKAPPPSFAYRSGGTLRLHRVVLELKPDDPEVDHVNGNRLDNRRVNLRVASHSENMQNRHGLTATNTSGYRGVSWHKRRRKWIAYAQLDGRAYYLGYFDTAEEADEAVKAWRAEHMPFSADARA